MKEIFNSFDRDGNGIISSIEFSQGLRMLGAEVNDADANLVYRFCDVNGDGEMDFDDFMGLIDQDNCSMNKGGVMTPLSQTTEFLARVHLNTDRERKMRIKQKTLASNKRSPSHCDDDEHERKIETAEIGDVDQRNSVRQGFMPTEEGGGTCTSLSRSSQKYLRRLEKSGRTFQTHREALHAPPMHGMRRMPGRWAEALTDGKLLCRTVLRTEHLRCSTPVYTVKKKSSLTGSESSVQVRSSGCLF